MVRETLGFIKISHVFHLIYTCSACWSIKDKGMPSRNGTFKLNVKEKLPQTSETSQTLSSHAQGVTEALCPLHLRKDEAEHRGLWSRSCISAGGFLSWTFTSKFLSCLHILLTACFFFFLSLLLRMWGPNPWKDWKVCGILLLLRAM